MRTGAVEALKFDDALGVDRRGQHGFDLRPRVGRESVGVEIRDAAPRLQRERARRGVVHVQRAEPRVEQPAAAAGQGGEQVAFIEPGDERVTEVDERLELRGLTAQALGLPQAVQRAGGLGGEPDEAGEVRLAVSVSAVGIEIDDTDDLPFGKQRRGHFAAHLGARGDVARLDADIGHELGFAVERHPAGEALAEFERKFTRVRRQALLRHDLEVTGVRVEE